MSYGKERRRRLRLDFWWEYIERELAREMLKKGRSVKCRTCDLSILDSRQLSEICPKATPKALHRVRV